MVAAHRAIELALLTWGLLHRRPINTRSETVATSGMFKDALARRRCLVPADAFYEWKVIEGGWRLLAASRPHAGSAVWL